MKILITGSSGFLGKYLVEFFKKKKFYVVELNSKNCDLTYEQNINKFSFEKYDYVFHLAAWTQAGDFCLNFPGDQWLINQKINTNVLQWWLTHQSQAKLIFMGTSCVYAPNGSLKEEEYMTGEPIDSLYTYAMTKRMLYQGAKSLSKQYGLKYICVVPSTLYGPGYHADGRQKHFIFDLISKIIRGKEFGEQVVLWGDGYQKREIVLVNDFVKILWPISQKFNNEIFNNGACEEFSIREFVKIICEKIGDPEKLIIYDTNKYVGAKSKCLNINKVKKFIPNYIMTDLKTGISETINWFMRTKSYDIKSGKKS